MKSIIFQHTSFRQSHPHSKTNIQPKTNTSLNIFSQKSIPQNSHLKHQFNSSQSIELTHQIKSSPNKKKFYASDQSQPFVNPFCIENPKSSAHNESSSQNEDRSPLTAEVNKEPNQKKDQSTGWGHSLIKFIVQRSTNRTIQHQINVIPSDVILHKKAPQNLSDQLIKQTQAALVSGKKLNQVYSKIRTQFQNLQLIKNKSQYNPQTHERAKSSNSLIRSHKNQSITNKSLTSTKSLASLSSSSSQTKRKYNRIKTQPNNKIITPSGIATYQFKSLKAEKSLIYKPLNDKSQQQILQTQLKSIKDRLKCATGRAHKIQYRSVSNKLKETKHKQIAFKQGLVNCQLKEMNTSQYLKYVLDEKNKIDKIYGEEGSRLHYINYLMKELSFQRPLALESVDFIDQMIKEEMGQKNEKVNPENSQRRNHYGSEQNQDEIMLSNRKKMIYRQKKTRKLHDHRINQQKLSHRSGLILNHLTFLNQY